MVMFQKIKCSVKQAIRLLTFILAVPLSIVAQHNGDELAYQGLAMPNDVNARALGMGGASTALTGDFSAIFYNAAGLAEITDLKLNFSAQAKQNLWRENQVWQHAGTTYPISFLLGGMQIPGPEWDGVWADTVGMFNPEEFSMPLQGVDVFSEEAADWQKKENRMPLFNTLGVAMPLDVGNQHLVVAASFNRAFDIADYDQNDTFLDPHVGDRMDPRVQAAWNDTLHMNWFRFQRERTGALYKFTGAVAWKMSNHFSIGGGVSSYGGETEDFLAMEKVGSFDLTTQNFQQRFFHENHDIRKNGTSNFSGTYFTLGGIAKTRDFQLGISMRSPYTLTREWNYTRKVSGSDAPANMEENLSGIDEAEIPAAFTVGVGVQAHPKVLLAFDYEHNPYSNIHFRFADQALDSTHYTWVNQNTLRFGIEYQIIDRIALRAGYRDRPQAFLPAGTLYQDKGPSSQSITLGTGIEVLHGRIDIAYEWRSLKYTDVYEINHNYVTTRRQNILLGYTLSF